MVHVCPRIKRYIVLKRRMRKMIFIQHEERRQVNGLKGLVGWGAKWWQD